jgi:hypothetical protein
VEIQLVAAGLGWESDILIDDRVSRVEQSIRDIEFIDPGNDPLCNCEKRPDLSINESYVKKLISESVENLASEIKKKPDHSSLVDEYIESIDKVGERDDQ